MYHDTTVDTAETRRVAERTAFANVTAGLEHAIDDANAKRQALVTNRLFWGVLKDNLFYDENQLTTDLKGQIFSLATWVETYTDKLLRGDADEIRPLINVNATIMAGLA